MSYRVATPPVLLETVDPALNRVAGLVVLSVEGRRAATGAATALAVADLVGRLGDGAADPASAQVSTVGARRVRLMGGEGRRELTFVGASRAFEYARA
ncbi:hypothetical protein GCM10017674_23090 [Streptomyces gardneri]|nr:hypothetical protein GCM10017674_23090 [Streptomyces gardneri]